MFKTPRQIFIGLCSRENSLAVDRTWLKLMKGRRAPNREILGDGRERSYQPMDATERHLKSNASLAANQYSIATIALYAFAPVNMYLIP